MTRKNILFLKRSIDHVLKNKSMQIRRLSNWTSDNVLKSPYKDIEVPHMLISDYVWQNLDKWPERTAAVCAVTGRGYTYEQAFRLSNNFAANLRTKLKIRDGDTVAVMLPNLPDFPLIMLGILEAGAVATTVNPAYTAHEVQKQLVASNSKVIVCLPENVNVVKAALKMAKMDIPIIAVKTNGEAIPEGTILFSELSESNVDKTCLKEVRRSYTDISLLPYSSGTSGLPKGVELTHANIVANCQQMNEHAIRTHNETTKTHQDAVMTVLPFFHIYALSVIMFHKMSQGVKMVTIPKLSPEVYFNSLEEYKTNVIFVAPPLVLLMASHPLGTPKTLGYLDTIINGAAPLGASDAERLMTKAKREYDFRQGYGLTETSPVATMTPKGLNNHSCVGHPLPSTHIKIVDDNLKALGLNQKGEILIKGPQVMKGYRNNPTANAEVFTDDGYFRSGDLGVINEDGIISISDRLKELIKVKGFQVPPAELEGVLRDHKEVVDAAVIGVPHPTNGEAPKAFVVLKPGSKTKDKEIKEFVKERVAKYKQIDDVVFVDEIPKSAAGKILRRVLREKFC